MVSRKKFYTAIPNQYVLMVEKETFAKFTVSRVDEQKVESKFFRSGRFLTLTCASSLTVAPQKEFGALLSQIIYNSSNISSQKYTLSRQIRPYIFEV